MDKVLIGIVLITVVFLILVPSILLINCMFNKDPEKENDLSDEHLMKLELKMTLLKVLDQWIKDNDLTHVQIAQNLHTNINVVSNIVYQRYDKFTIDQLVVLVLRSGKSVKFVT